ncbi:MAG: hypothetical protein JSV91_02705 [Phycisphaerales bacterium]|nr:MAG: hypothetical protein JSV91_02705 [Phycisphaerales bacterium]
MPLYEYRCEQDGATITLLRPMADADKAVEDPQGRGRTFIRVLSSFSVGSALPCEKGSGIEGCPSCRLDGSCGL